MSTTDFEIAFAIPEVTDAFDPRVSEVEGAMDVVVSSHGGLSVATVIAGGSDAIAAGRTASAILSSCGLPPQRTYPDLVSRQDIADRLDVSRQAVGNWVRGERHHEFPFPAPVNMVAGGVWLWGDIAVWLRRTGRDSDELEFPTLADHARLDGILVRSTESELGKWELMRRVGTISARIGFDSTSPEVKSGENGYMVLCKQSA